MFELGGETGHETAVDKRAHISPSSTGGYILVFLGLSSLSSSSPTGDGTDEYAKEDGSRGTVITQ